MDKKLSEPIASYGKENLLSLKERLIVSVNSCKSAEDPERCVEILRMDSMPCFYTDDEFRQILMRAETEGNAVECEVRKFFAGWGISEAHMTQFPYCPPSQE